MYTVLGRIELEEQTVWDRRSGKERRPFRDGCGARAHGYSRRLQRAISDFGADESFARAAAKVAEHYGLTLPVSGCRRVTLQHALACHAHRLPAGPTPPAEQLIGEMDGSMVPIVTPTAPPSADRRQGKRLAWKEAKLALIRRPGETSTRVAASLDDAQASGEEWSALAKACGFGKRSRLHAVGDGAPWIAEQVERHFGRQATYLVDFFHVCEHLAPVAAYAGGDASAWLDVQKSRLRANDWPAVLDALAPWIEPEPQAPTPARDCDRYLRARSHQLNYRDALAADLPIGSGEVESAHRSVVQHRLKKPGAWWRSHTAQAMLDLCCLRHNDQWDRYWQSLASA